MLITGLAMLAVVEAPRSAVGQEKDLNQGHPVRLEDAFPIAAGEATLLGTATAAVPHHGSATGLLQLDAQYGLLPRTQLSLSTLLSTEPGETSDPAFGDLMLAAKIGFGSASGPLPLFASQIALTVPTGIGSRSVDIEVKGYATKDVTIGLLPLFAHLNGSAQFRATERASDERLVRYHLAAGLSATVPQLAAMTLVADMFVDQAVKRGEAETIGMEAGLRYRVSPKLAIHSAVGTEVAGPADRAAFFARAGLSFGFEGPAFGR